MPDHEEIRRTALRPVAQPRDAGDNDATAALRAAIGMLDTKLHAAGGFSRVVDWLQKTERLLAGIQDVDLERNRREIRELIDRLLELNARVQTLVRLKRLFS